MAYKKNPAVVTVVNPGKPPRRKKAKPAKAKVARKKATKKANPKARKIVKLKRPIRKNPKAAPRKTVAKKRKVKAMPKKKRVVRRKKAVTRKNPKRSKASYVAAAKKAAKTRAAKARKRSLAAKKAARTRKAKSRKNPTKKRVVRRKTKKAAPKRRTVKRRTVKKAAPKRKRTMKRKTARKNPARKRVVRRRKVTRRKPRRSLKRMVKNPMALLKYAAPYAGGFVVGRLAQSLAAMGAEKLGEKAAMVAPYAPAIGNVLAVVALYKLPTKKVSEEAKKSMAVGALLSLADMVIRSIPQASPYLGGQPIAPLGIALTAGDAEGVGSYGVYERALGADYARALPGGVHEYVADTGVGEYVADEGMGEYVTDDGMSGYQIVGDQGDLGQESFDVEEAMAGFGDDGILGGGIV